MTPAAFALTVSPEVVAPDGVGSLAAPPAPARDETDAEPAAGVPEDAAASAAVAGAVAAALADAAAATAAGEALPSTGKDPPPDAAGRYLGGSLFLAGLLWT